MYLTFQPQQCDCPLFILDKPYTLVLDGFWSFSGPLYLRLLFGRLCWAACFVAVAVLSTHLPTGLVLHIVRFWSTVTGIKRDWSIIEVIWWIKHLPPNWLVITVFLRFLGFLCFSFVGLGAFKTRRGSLDFSTFDSRWSTSALLLNSLEEF